MPRLGSLYLPYSVSKQISASSGAMTALQITKGGRGGNITARRNQNGAVPATRKKNRPGTGAKRGAFHRMGSLGVQRRADYLAALDQLWGGQ